MSHHYELYKDLSQGNSRISTSTMGCTKWKLHSGLMFSCHLTNNPCSLGLSAECKQREIKLRVQALSLCAATCRFLSKAKCRQDICNVKTRDFWVLISQHQRKDGDLLQSLHGQLSPITGLGLKQIELRIRGKDHFKGCSQPHKKTITNLTNTQPSWHYS